MATQVELGSALAPLTNIGERRNETPLRRTFAGPFSEPGAKNGDERNRFGNPAARLTAMPPAASRPRLTPRPFSRERSWETFAVVKPPVSNPKPVPNSSSENPAAAAEAAAKGSSANIPPLLDQKSIEIKSSRDLVANIPFYPNPQLNTVILFETASHEDQKVRGNPNKMSNVKQETPSETSQKPEAESGPVSRTSRKSLERKDTFSGSDGAGKDPSEVPPRPKQRPVSAIFLESLKDPKTSVADLPDETKPVPEKPWGRKPRPLSMDLTAKFENVSAQRRACPSESKETAGLGSADSSIPNPIPIPNLNPKVVDICKSATPNRKSPPEEPSLKNLRQFSSGKKTWEFRDKSQDGEKERGSEISEISKISDKIKTASLVAEISGKSESPVSKEKVVLNQNESRFGIENPVENQASKGTGLKKSGDFSDPSAVEGSSTTPNAESFSENFGKETRILNIQQRIKELTGDNMELKPGNLRRSFRSRPLSSDLTKLFSGSPSGADTTRKPSNESQDLREKERTPPFGRETKEAGNPRITKTTFTEAHQDGRCVKERHSAPVPQGNVPLSVPVSAAVHNPKSHPVPENAGVKTVRATLFEHNVERHTVAAAKCLATEPKPWPSDPSNGQAGPFRESWVEKVLDAKVATRKASSAATDAEKTRRTIPVNEDKTAWEKRVFKEKGDQTFPKTAEDPLVYQRIEPRYEILQTIIGERVRSEAVAAATEDKAVTLRSRRSLKERRKTDSVFADAVRTRSFDVRGWEEEIPVPKDPGESGVNATPKGSPHERVAEANETGPNSATAKASYFANRTKDWERTEEKALNPEAEKDRRDAKEGPRTPKRITEDFGTDPGRTEACESRASVEKSATGDRENGHGTSQRRIFAHPSGDPPKISGQDGSRVLSLREGSDVSDGRSQGDGFREVVAGERFGKSGRGISLPKPTERWRRKTLPHDAFRTEEIQERGKSPVRRDSFRFRDGSVAKRSAEEARDGRSTTESHLKTQLSSPPGSKATYFALTYQIPNASTKPSDPPQNRPDPSPAGDVSVPPIGKTHRLDGNRFPETQGSPERDLGRSGGDGDPSEIPSRGLLKHPQTEGSNWDPERAAADPGFPIPRSGTKSPSRLGSILQDRKSPGQKKSSDPNPKRNEKSADGYRSRVLDLDALMAEYKEDPKKGSAVQGIPPEEIHAFSRDKSSQRRRSSEKTDSGYAQRRRDLSPPGSRKAEILEIYNQDPLKDVKRGPPRWGIQGLEKPADQSGVQKKTFIVDEEEEGADLVRRHQTAKRADYGAETDYYDPPSRALSEGAPWKGLRKEANLPSDVDLSGFGKRTVRESEASALAGRVPESGFADAAPDLRRSYSEKVRQSRARGGGLFPFGRKAEDQSGDRRSVPPPEVADHRLSRRSGSPRGVFPSDGRKPDVVEKEGTEGSVPKNLAYLGSQRRSCSFYRERRTDHWSMDQLKQCFGRPAGGAKDTETLVQETESQYGTWQDQPESADSFAPESPSSESVSVPARKPASGGGHLSSSSSHTDPTSDPTDPSFRDRQSASPAAETSELAAPSGTSPDFSFLEETPVLDSSALKTRVQLSKRRRQRRTPISNSLRRSGVQEEESRPRTSERRREESDEEGRPRTTERSPDPQTPQRLPVFPGIDHSAFKAQLRKRQEQEVATTGTGSGVSAQSSRSPKSPFSAGSQILTTGTGKEERSEEISPQWMKELKSKKRQSQYENQV